MNILSEKIVTTRKKHSCSACFRFFEKGTKMKTQVKDLKKGDIFTESGITNIIVDLIADRKPFSKYSIEIFKKAEEKKIKLFTSSHFGFRIST